MFQIKAVQKLTKTPSLVKIGATSKMGAMNFSKSALALCPQGRVKFFNTQKGFGFIQQDNGQDVFVHMSKLSSPDLRLNPGDDVVFETAEGRKGVEARNVRKVEDTGERDSE